MKKNAAFASPLTALPNRGDRRAVCSARSWRAAAAQPTASTEPVTTGSWAGANELSKNASHTPAVMSVEEVMKILPHRYPFLLVDKVVAVESGERAVAVKAVSANEPFFQGHFPDRKIMPGVLQVEALAQVGGIVLKDVICGDGDDEPKDFFFGGVDKVRWRKPVVPGDVLFMEAEMVSYKARFGIAKMKGKAYTDGSLVCEVDLTLAVDVKGKAKSS